jgi:hypothetical protein
MTSSETTVLTFFIFKAFKDLSSNDILSNRIDGDTPRHPVEIETGYGLDDGGIGVRVPVLSRIFSSPRHIDWFLDPPSLLYNGHLWLFPGVKLPRHEADHSALLCAEVIHTHSTYVFMAWCLINYAKARI